LIKDILDLAKIGAGRLTLYISSVSVESACQASLRFIKQEATKKQLKVSFALKSNIKTFNADERRLKQILVNLLINAIKFTPNGGEVGLEVTREPSQESICFTVWDTGVGIAKEDIGDLFQPFVQLDGTFTRKHSGTGLGLSLVSRMVDMHGGSIRVESEPGKGSRFMVVLPLKASQLEAAEQNVSQEIFSQFTSDEVQNLQGVEEQTYESCRKKILIAEDQEANIEILSTYLGYKGYKVLVARNGKEAIAQSRSEHPDVVVMDIQMPEMDGLQAIRAIRADSRFDSVPVIALTALAMPGDRERCLAAGANEYLSKPVNLKQLELVIQGVLKE
jgi:CheY-like chemotaxis protein